MKKIVLYLIVLGVLIQFLLSSGCSSISLNGGPSGSYQGYRSERANSLILYQDGEFEEYIWGSGQRTGTWSVDNSTLLLMRLKNSQNFELYHIQENYLIGLAGHRSNTKKDMFGDYAYEPYTYKGETVYFIDAPANKYEKVSSSTNLKRDMGNQFIT